VAAVVWLRASASGTPVNSFMRGSNRFQHPPKLPSGVLVGYAGVSATK
jgi:hypothetical protein